MPPKKRNSLRARAAKTQSISTRPTNAVKPSASSSASGRPRTKETKRTLKRDRLLNRVRDADVQKAAAVKKRRRPGKKLKAAEDWGGMMEALPEVPSPVGGDVGEGDEEEEWEGIPGSDEEGGADMMAGVRKTRRRRREEGGNGKMVMASLRHRPGAMKRKRMMEQREVERFGRNLAQMTAPATSEERSEEPGGGGAGARQSEKWAALRRFIGGTMERDAAFGSSIVAG